MNLLEDLNNPLWKSKNIIYCYTNKINNKKYIGQVNRKKIGTLKTRHTQHVCNSYNEKNQKDYNSPFHKAIRKYGINNFKLEIIHIGKEKRELDYFEDFYIKYYNSYAKYQLGYNIAKGGTGGNLIKGKTDEEIMKIRRKQSESLKGNQNAKGKILSKETRQKMSESHKDKKQSEASKNKMRGINNKKSKLVAQYDLNNNLIKIYTCIREASEENNINYSTLRTYLQRNKSYNLSGFIWKYHKEVK